MGSARHRSWSHSRGRLADECPRALYFAYYPWNDEEQDQARFLRRLASPQSLAGTIVHRQMTLGLRQFVRKGTYPRGLHLDGLREYDAALAESRRIAGIVRSGRRPPDGGTALSHHVYGAEDPEAERKGRDTVVCSLAAFESSTALAFLRTTNFDRWEGITTDSDDVPSFVATADLGFSGAAGLRVYANHDLALRWGDDFVIVDWKTGARTPRGEHAARRQLAVYGLWAMANGWRIDRVRLLAYWLQEDDAWEPTALDERDVKSVVDTIEAHDAMERAGTSPIADKNGAVVKYEADREAFPAAPEPRKCGFCAYRTICAEGKTAVAQSTPPCG